MLYWAWYQDRQMYSSDLLIVLSSSGLVIWYYPAQIILFYMNIPRDLKGNEPYSTTYFTTYIQPPRASMTRWAHSSLAFDSSQVLTWQSGLCLARTLIWYDMNQSETGNSHSDCVLCAVCCSILCLVAWLLYCCIAGFDCGLPSSSHLKGRIRSRWSHSRDVHWVLRIWVKY